MLRAGDELNLEKENELLRQEINRSKRFIATIVDSANQASKLSDEMKMRVLVEGVDAAIGQIVGLLYTSNGNGPWSHWVAGGPFDVQDSNALVDTKMHLKIQYAPLGSSFETAKRTNVRYDWYVRRSMEDIDSTFWRFWFKGQHVKTILAKYLKKFQDGSSRIEQTAVVPEFLNNDWAKDHMQIYHHVEEHAHYKRLDGTIEPIKVDAICAFSRKEVTIFPAGLVPVARCDGTEIPVPKEPVKCMCVCMTSSNAVTEQTKESVPLQQGFKRIEQPMLEGYLLRPAGDGGTIISSVMSFPVDGEGFLGLEPQPIMYEDGTLSETSKMYVRILSALMKTDIEKDAMDSIQ